jgi:protein-S-isoprenylcysteine O-methyltransferase Ste14
MVVVRFLAGILLFGVFVFIPAGTLQYWQAWVYLAVLFVPLAVFGLVLFTREPKLLERRMRMRETQAEQKRAIAALTLLLLIILVIPGLDRRFSWSSAPPGLVILADLIILLGYALFVLTIRENQFASRVVEVQEGQAVISSGPYAVVRHPMYLATTLMFGLTPLALGSYWGLIASALFPVMLAARIRNEEAVLREGLVGYADYARKVRYRLIPFVW